MYMNLDSAGQPFVQKFITDIFENYMIDHVLLSRIFGEAKIWEFDEEEDRLAETWHVWTGNKDGRQFTLTHKFSGLRYDGPADGVEYARELIIKQKWKESVKSC